jgi:hypothetical protein
MSKTLTAFLIVILCSAVTTFSQNNGKPLVAPGYYNQAVDFSQISGSDLSKSSNHVKLSQPRTISTEERALFDQQRQYKLQGNIQGVKDLDAQLQAIRTNTVTKTGGSSNGATIVYNGGQPVGGMGDINSSQFFQGGVKGMCTQTEQVGANLGRVWAFLTRDTTAGIADRGQLYYTDNGGVSWSLYVTLTLGGTDKFASDQTDMEMIEGTTGDKYVWIVYTYVTAGASKVGLLGVDITTFNAGVIGMVWPGNDATKKYYRPRISSDNPSFGQTGTWVFIVCSFDSVAGTGFENCQKYAEIHTATGVATPTVIYQGPMFSWYQGVSSGGYHRDLHTDICYYRNGGSDSLMVTFSNVPDSTRIFMGASAEGSFSLNAATRTGTTSNYHQQYTTLYSPATTVGNNIVMVTRRNFNNGGDWDVYNYRSTNGCITGSAWTTGYVDGSVSTTNVPCAPDVTGKRGVLDARVAYTLDNATQDSCIYVASSGAAWSATRVRMSYIDTSPFYAAPKASFRMGGGDDCLAIWANYGATQVWSSRLCTSTVGISGNTNSIPHTYSLMQNYPNPFNPSTTIQFNLPKSGDVKLQVFDILGKEVAVPVNEFKNAGTYSVVFDASTVASGIYFYTITSGSFTDTKKMLLVK